LVAVYFHGTSQMTYTNQLVPETSAGCNLAVSE